MKSKLSIIGVSIALSSCAYLQTHKNVEQAHTHYDGQILRADTMELHRSGDTWYLSARRAKYRLVYPIVHDEVFRKFDTEPSFHLLENSSENIYHPISAASAQVLQRRDGYFTLNALAADIKRTPGTWVMDLPNAQRHNIEAEVTGTRKCYMEQQRIPQETPSMDKTLGYLDFVFVDIPGTLLYNVSIPLMAPFVFFSEFLSDD